MVFWLCRLYGFTKATVLGEKILTFEGYNSPSPNPNPYNFECRVLDNKLSPDVIYILKESSDGANAPEGLRISETLKFTIVKGAIPGLGDVK
jgi:hypothetical protein